MTYDSLRVRAWIIIFLLTLAAWWPTLRLGFIADDPFLIRGDPTIQRWDWATLRSDFGPAHFGDANLEYYRPFQKLFIRAEFSLFGFNPIGYHAVNLFLHASVAALTSEVAAALGFAAPVSVLVGSLLAVHPILVHDALQATGIETFSYFLFAAAFLFYLHRRPQVWIPGLFVYTLALFSKESAVMLPFVYMLSALLRPDLPILRVVVPCLLMVCPYGLLRWAHMGNNASIVSQGIVRFLFQAFPKILWHYTLLFYAPLNLQSWPPIAHLSHFWLLYLLAGGFAAWLLWRGLGRQGLFCFGWILLLFLPKIPALMKNGVMMDHWAFDSALGYLLLLVLFGQWLWQRSATAGKIMIALMLCGIVVFWTDLSRYYVRVRGSDELNYRWTLRFDSPDFALYRLGIILMRTGRPGEAVNYLERLCAQTPEQADYENALALAYAHAGRLDRAIDLWQALLRRAPAYAPARANLDLMRRLSNSKAAR